MTLSIELLKEKLENSTKEELIETVFLWRSYALSEICKNKVYVDILLENGINPTLSEINRRMNIYAFGEK